MYIHLKKWWQSGSTEKYSVEALCTRSSMLCVNSTLSYICIYIYICVYEPAEQVCAPNLNIYIERERDL